jgi:hypothetical protein
MRNFYEGQKIRWCVPWQLRGVFRSCRLLLVPEGCVVLHQYVDISVEGAAQHERVNPARLLALRSYGLAALNTPRIDYRRMV